MLYFNRDSEPMKAVSITEFLLAHPCLSLAVFDSRPSSPVHRRVSDTASGPTDLSSCLGWLKFACIPVRYYSIGLW